ncbi:hypothetical protein BC941DRAFT_435033 [Chlamydoabsidia padenii]|nr:hypothetical protein BC941DRAFT_435033 [Chlamydoabsidia padenii]
MALLQPSSDLKTTLSRIVSYLTSFTECGPFMMPVPPDATIYHAKVKHPMDLNTIERRIASGYYHTLSQFEDDLNLVWTNATDFNHRLNPIHRQALALQEYYQTMDTRIEKGKLKISGHPIGVPPLPPNSSPNEQSVFYMTLTVSPDPPKSIIKRFRGYGKVRTLYEDLHGPLFKSILGSESSRQSPPPRLYISKNRSCFQEAVFSTNKIFSILWNTQFETLSDDRTMMTTNVTLAVPFKESLHDILTSTYIATTSATVLDYSPKTWVKLHPTKTHYNVRVILSKKFDLLYFRKPYTTQRIDTDLQHYIHDDKGITNRDKDDVVYDDEDMALLKRMVHSLSTGESQLPDGHGNFDKMEGVASYSVKEEEVNKDNSNCIQQEDTLITATPTDQAGDTTDTINNAGHNIDGAGIISNERQINDNATTTVNEDHQINNNTATINDDQTSNPTTNNDRLDSITDIIKNEDQVISSTSTTNTDDLAINSTSTEEVGHRNAMAKYRDRTTELFGDLKKYSISKNVNVVSARKYMEHITSYANAEGYFKQVRYVENDKNIVVQTFRRMTTSQRAIELISLLKLKGLPHMAEITEVLHADDNVNDVVGLAMRRYQRTLKQYTHAHTHHRLSAHQKMDLIRQMLICLDCIHSNGIAHRDLSEVNFMVDEQNDPEARRLDDGSVAAYVYLIDFGKAVFTRPEDVRRWWIEPMPLRKGHDLTSNSGCNNSSNSNNNDNTTAATTATSGDILQVDDYDGEVIPANETELETWCTNLPMVRVKPDHGYRCYRSIQTLPRNRVDHAVLPWLVDPIAEDMYSIGALIWKVFAETEPWHGILDTDLRGLREMVADDETIRTQVHREVAGDLSRQLLLKCLCTQPEDRASASTLLAWLDNPNIATGLLEEWAEHAPTERKKRHAKSAFEFEEEQAAAAAKAKRDRKKQKQLAEKERKRIEAEEAKTKARMEKQRKREMARLQQQQQRQQGNSNKEKGAICAAQGQFRQYQHFPMQHTMPPYGYMPPPNQQQSPQHQLGKPTQEQLYRQPLYAYPPHPPYVQLSQPGYYPYQQAPFSMQYYYSQQQQQQRYPPPPAFSSPPGTTAVPTEAVPSAPPLTSTSSASSSTSSSPHSSALIIPLRPTTTRPIAQPPTPMIFHYENNVNQNPYLSRISRPTSNVREPNPPAYRHPNASSPELSIILVKPPDRG